LSAKRGTDSGGVTDAGKASDSKEESRRCFSIGVVRDREFKFASRKLFKNLSRPLRTCRLTHWPVEFLQG
jgi:hypothetical protein